jgi:hypothetical protein
MEIDTSKLLNIDYLKETGAEPSWFGLGFIQLKLNSHQRVHFWSPQLEADVGDEEIHDHRYFFNSTILKGSLEQTLYHFEVDTHGMWEMRHVSCTPGETAPTHRIRGNPHEVSRQNMTAGCSYSIASEVFHTTHVEQDTVTFLQRKFGSHNVKEFARVIAIEGAPEVCPFSNPKPVAELWEWIAEIAKPNSVAKPGYHKAFIQKGTLGEASKIKEEIEEFFDALDQGVHIMALVELSDLIGSISAYLEKHHPQLTIKDLIAMSDVTKRAFLNGHRN